MVTTPKGAGRVWNPETQKKTLGIEEGKYGG
jgi:hypothetical protein